MTTPLLSTKLFIPEPHTRLVARPRLVQQLNHGATRKLILICAPAGFGKTTLVSEWIHQSPRRTAWLSLDESDNDPIPFWDYFIAALQSLQADLGESVRASLRTRGQITETSIEPLLTVLINEIAAIPHEFTLVLDDYHVVNAARVHDGISFLLNHIPPQLHLIIISRADPPLPLARLRARDEMIELRAADLRFTGEETSSFLNQVSGLALTEANISALDARTEGWIVGLQLAALSIKEHRDPTAFIESFTGNHRFILDYLMEEVLRRQSADTQEFLLQTSILDRLCAELCDALLESQDSQLKLEQLEHANLFLVPLDHKRHWYRYHHLFAEVLRHRFQHDQPERTSELHRRASGWHEAAGFTADAIRHALAAGDIDRVVLLIEQSAEALIGRGEVATLHLWLDTVPDEIISIHPRLMLAYAWTYSLTGELESMSRRLAQVEQFLNEAEEQETLSRREANVFRGEIETLRAYHALGQNDLPRAIALCKQAQMHFQNDRPWVRSLIFYIWGLAEWRAGNLVEFEQAMPQAAALGKSGGNIIVALYALSYLATFEELRGRLHQAESIYRQALQLANENGRAPSPAASVAYTGLGKLFYEWNDLETATRYLREGLTLRDRGGFCIDVDGDLLLANILQVQGDFTEAEKLIYTARQYVESWERRDRLNHVANFEARLALMRGDLSMASRWARDHKIDSTTDLNAQLEIEFILKARLLLAQEKFNEACHLLERISFDAEKDGRTGRAIEALILLSLARQAQGQRNEAFAALDQALSLAESEGYIRIFINEGEPMRRLLANFQPHPALRAYMDKLLASFPGLEAAPVPQTFEALSARETELLRLIAVGSSTAQIADELVITVGTARNHIKNIYRKLDAHNRVQAVQRARELSLI